MKIKIDKARELAVKALEKLGFEQSEAELIADNFMAGELTGKKSHGLNRITYYQLKVNQGRIDTTPKTPEIIKETPVSLVVDGKNKTGLYVVNWALERGIKKTKESGIAVVSCTNTAPMSGLIGQYAQKAAQNDLIYIGFNNSPTRTSGIVLHGSLKRLTGTNPLTIGVPTHDLPIILDMASSKITVGDVILAWKRKTKLKKGTIIDKKGRLATDPKKAMDESRLGGILPIFGHKGSGLALIVEVLGGGLTASMMGNKVKGGWGSLAILIDPNILRPIDEFKDDVKVFLDELKSSPKAPGFKEIFYPGEQSQKKRVKHLESGEIEVEDRVYKEIQKILSF